MELWESQRYDWARLHGAFRPAVDVPRALESLRTASSEEEAEEAFNQIDNNVVVQDAIYEPALATAACIVSMLTTCTPTSRVHVLELLERVSGGEPEPGCKHTLTEIAVEVARGFAVYVDLLQHGTDLEREFCVDLLISSAEADHALRDRVRFYLQKLAEDFTASTRAREYSARRLAYAAADWWQKEKK